MININFQLSIIVFSIIYGLLFYYLLFICRYYLCYKNIIFRFINTITFFLLLSNIYFIGLDIICDGILHVYSLIIIVFIGTIEHFIEKKKK